MKVITKVAVSAIVAANSCAYSVTDNHLSALGGETETMMPIVQFGVDESDVYGAVAHSQYSNFLSPNSATSFLLDYGAKQFRLDLTWAYAPTSHQRFKISGQQLSQDNDYDFASGQDHQFIGQTAVGAEYEYILHRRFPHAIHIGGYYFSANNGDLDNMTFTTAAGDFLDQRGIVGGSGGGINIGPRLKPWQGGELKFGLGYDQVSFNSQTEPAKDSSGFGSNVYFSQQISPQMAFVAAMEDRQPYQQYSAGFTWMPYQKLNKQLGLKLEGRHVNSDIFSNASENIIGLSLVYRWDGNPILSGSRVCENTETSCALLAWSTQSAARLPSVFVQKDETVSPD